MNTSESQHLQTRRRALTSLPLPQLNEENSCLGMELEDNESYHDLPPSPRHRYLSPDVSVSTKRKLNTTCTTNFNSTHKFLLSNQKSTEKLHDDLYFDNALEKSTSLELCAPLATHEITEKFRGKMMDWMIEVLKIYQQKEATIFKSFFILDCFLARHQGPIKSSELHLIGTCCMFIASKQEEVAPIRLNVLYEEVCKAKFSKEEIIETELRILRVINFQTHQPTLYDLCRLGLRLLDLEDREISLFIENISLLISKMSLFSIDIIGKLTYSQIAACALILSLKLVENLKTYFSSDVCVI